jgi:hypothetical protein
MIVTYQIERCKLAYNKGFNLALIPGQIHTSLPDQKESQQLLLKNFIEFSESVRKLSKVRIRFNVFLLGFLFYFLELLPAILNLNIDIFNDFFLSIFRISFIRFLKINPLEEDLKIIFD